MAGKGSSLTTASWLIAGALAGGATIFVAALGTRAGLWDAAFGLGTLTFLVAPALTAIGLICAVTLAVWSARRPKALGLAAVFAVLAAGGTAAGLGLRWEAFHAATPWDVTSDREDPPGFSRILSQRRAASGAARATSPAGPQACLGAASTPSQLAPEAAAAALEAAGFTVIGSAAFRAEGERRGFWFGLTHDAVVRIRPGRTDVRVTARSDLPQGGETCRLAAALSRALAAQAGA
ncbi:MAG: DUF1499 domain-containing protein [Alphaproteobacteria bacterium]|nr:DUF1499 domain-containing protein [Alphaproteobacteria bacterium]MBU1525539.1 DUF1499 domain-containing protein [Alphaproteobacteria bacterium]MBU2350474.1 DUF1499 domain-containing protein [Alphaproteobacteria bacterium]MBU2381533.1 DUF1499 domain-containing protein [Alphaproteobacteria bacterium]